MRSQAITAETKMFTGASAGIDVSTIPGLNIASQ